MKRQFALFDQSWDWRLFCSALALSGISLVALTSAAAQLDPGLVLKQAIWVGLGIAACLVVASVPYMRWIDFGVFLYPLAVLLLVFVMIAGAVRLGASRWISVFGFSLQPSELAKLSLACLVSRYAAGQGYPIRWRGVAIAAVLTGVPALLIFAQPDLGTSSILGAIWLGTIWVAGMSRRLLAALAAAGMVAGPVGWHLLKDYQKLRLTAFINPDADPLGAGYTIIQSRIAIGSGRLLGRGWLSGTQGQLNFLPERHSDFLYSVVGEEWGFLGSLLVVALCGVVLWRMTAIARDTSDAQGRLLVAALVSWLGYQAVVNMGMVMGVLPVVGVPLPFVSYGGSAMVVSWIALGCALSVRRFGTRF